MYIPKHFQINEQEQIMAFIHRYSFGQLISNHQQRLFSSWLPFLLSEDERTLRCHLARQNPQWQSLDESEAMVTLSGPHGYISPSWYQDPGVPTWNFQAVHIYGRCRVIEDTEWLKATVEALTAVHETAVHSGGETQPWQPEYNENMLSAIVGVEIAIDDIEAKFKLSQNKSENDRQSVIAELERRGESDLAQAMRSMPGV